jgi:hypothetical protein
VEDLAGLAAALGIDEITRLTMGEVLSPRPGGPCGHLAVAGNVSIDPDLARYLVSR